MLQNLIFKVKSGCIITGEGQQINNTALPEIFRLLLDKKCSDFLWTYLFAMVELSKSASRLHSTPTYPARNKDIEQTSLELLIQLSLKTTALELFMGHRGSIAGYLPGVIGARPRELRNKGPVRKFLLFDEINFFF